MHRLFYFRKFWPIWIILVLEILLFATNYIPKTYLIGWDNLFPEFNFSVNFQRSIFAIWQEYRGLGLLDGMSHAANIVHYIFIYLLSFIFPQNLLRYVFTFLMHFFGGVGMYLLISNFQLPISKNEKFKKIFALFGALFYQYNFATIQMFYLPFELFIVHFAAIPWSFYFLRKFFTNTNKQNLFLLTLTSFLATPQAHVPSIFLVYAFAIGSFVVFTLLHNGRQILKPIIIALLVIILTNAFWGIPYFYSTIKNSRTIAESKNNQMGTDDIFLRNQAYGDFESVAQLKGLSLDFIQYDYTQKISDYMMQPWRNYNSQPIMVVATWILFFVSLFGLYWAIVKKCKELYPFAFLWIITFLILGNDIPIIGFFSYFLHTYIPYFHNVFRFVFTKFSFLYVVMYSVFISFGLYQIITLLGKKSEKYLGPFVVLFYLLLGIVSFPVFQNNFFYKNLKVPIPEDYFRVFNFFKSQSYSERIAILPTPWFWSWTQTNWGAIGSGFTWFGLPQSTVDRAFDPWSNKNENFYWELSQAIYSSDNTLFSNLLRKYQIGWLLLDESIIHTSSPKVINLGTLEEFLNHSSNINLLSQFGKIKIYKVDLNVDPKDFVFLGEDLPVVGPEYKWNNYDKAYEEYGNYISVSSTIGGVMASPPKADQPATPEVSLPHIYYPFRSLFTARQQNELEFGVARLRQGFGGQEGDYFSFKTQIPKELVGYKLILPAIEEKEVIELDANDLSKKSVKMPEIYLDGELVQVSFDPGSSSRSNDPGSFFVGVSLSLPYIREGNLEVRVPKINGYYSYNFDPTLMNLEPKTCDQFNKGIYKHDQISESGNNLLRLTSIGSSNCLDFDLPNLSQDIGYLVTVENRNMEGKSLLFSVINKNSQRADLETYLPKSKEVGPHTRSDLIKGSSGLVKSYFIIPPMEQYGLGYTLHLDNTSIGRVKTVNDLGKITVNPIPYRFLTSLKVVKVGIDSSTSEESWPRKLSLTPSEVSYRVEHPNPSLYQVILDSSTIGGVHSATPEVSLSPSNNTTLVLSQSFDDGWKAYSINSQHLTVNKLLLQLFPFWFGKEITDHVLVNNWENGWKLSNDNENIIIVYLPQYLEYIGFILLGVGILVVIFYPLPRHPRPALPAGRLDRGSI